MRKFLTLCCTAVNLLAAAPTLVWSLQAQAAGHAVLAIYQQPETLDPYNTNVTMTTAVTKSFYEGLFQFDKHLHVKHVLAESHEISKDGKIYTFNLRAGVKFHDGTDFDAEAVKVNLERARNPENRLLRAMQFSPIARIEVVDPLTVRITLKEPFGPFLNALAHPSAAMISPAALQKYGRDIALHPVGTGPFIFAEWKQTEAIVGKKFDGYWKPGYPKVDQVTWKPVTENNSRAAMLQTGEAHFAYTLPYEQAARLQKIDHLEVVSSPSIIQRFLALNLLQKPFDDLKVRQAIGYAINKQALAKVAFNGYATPARGFVPDGIQYALDMEPIAYDVQKAKALLEEAGYPNGFESVLWSGYANSTSQKVIQFVQQQLAQIGIKVSVQTLEPGQRVELVDAWPDPATAKLRLYYIGWAASTGEADWALRPLFGSQSWSPKLANNSFYSNAAFDDAIAQALVTVDSDAKAALYKTAQEQLARDLPRIPLVTERILSAQAKTLSGVYVMPDANIHMDDIELKSN